MIKRYLLSAALLVGSMAFVWAQETRQIAVESASVTNNEVTINGKRVPYKATAGTMPVWDEDGKPMASLFYTYYERTDVSDKTSRPLVISFNGGPGSASIWMHLAYTGPYKLNIDDEGYPLQPYGYSKNPHSILDVADIVFVDPVNTGYSRIVNKEVSRSTFFGVNADIRYLADWINTFVSRQNRWSSPKYLIGESYGTTRVAGLVSQLQNSHWMYFNGVILVSPTGLGLDRNGPVAAANYLPYYAATAWYHGVLPADLQSKDLDQILPEVEKYTLDEVLPAIARGGSLDAAKRKEIASKMAYYSGLSEKVILEHNLAVPTSFFWKELLRDQGLTIGRLDSRYRGIDKSDAGDRYDFDPALTSWNHAFAPAFNLYAKNVLKYETDLTYNLFGPVNPWDRSNDNTGEQLANAMRQNPYLHVMTQSGYFDGGTDYFNAKYNMWQMDPNGKLQDRMSFKGYRSGHMMYLRAEDLKTSNDDIREFIMKTIPAKDQPAKY
ncbi:S10 family peptidase [Belliella pelovolcani]|jgi:carboxypeptidase C (cathepsin A)|uniref:Carboxypeptidase C (Cathepsin A) n=1 Tax=Belliella pelovolcani TaxID=529505 RepID=A0A1N7MPU4_9BACT|nr:carboxypeptidase [Belliella pelovolcani]SIS88070.1 Carboxypeptidase C (cathepsin A) [Belliella pelovolcani]